MNLNYIGFKYWQTFFIGHEMNYIYDMTTLNFYWQFILLEHRFLPMLIWLLLPIGFMPLVVR